MTIRPLTNREEWNAFLLTLSPNTFLQCYEWGELQAEMNEGVRYLGIFENARQVGAALVITVRARRGHHWLIPHGPLVAQEKDFFNAVKTVAAYLRGAAAADGCVSLRVAPLTLATPKNLSSLQSLGFRPAPLHVHSELTWMLDITPDEETLGHGMRKTSRHAIQKAHSAGVRVTTVPLKEGVARFLPLYEHTKLRHGFTPFPARCLEAQVRLFGAHNMAYATIASHNGRDVAGSLLMHFGNTVFYHHGASIKLPSNVPASHLLQWHNIQEAKRRGATHYNFWGIAPENAPPQHPFAGLTVFKKGFGGYPLDYLHAHDLPLDQRYWLLWGVERLRKWQRGF